MTRLAGLAALQVRGWAPGFFDRASCPGEKLARIHAGHPAGFPPPTRRVIRGPLRAKSQEPELRARAAGLLWERTCARQADGAVHPCVAVAHKCAPTESTQVPASTRPSPRPSPRWGEGEVRRTAKTNQRRCAASSALSPQRFGRVAQCLEVPLGYPPMEIRWDAPRAFVLGFNTMLPALKAISLGYFSLLRASCPPPFGPASPFACAPAHAWASKEK